MQHFTLYELNQKIKSVLSSELEPTYWVIAEIGEMRVGQNGHCYLDLVEKNDNYLYAKIRATIWCNTFRNVGAWFESIAGEPIRPGLKVLLQAEVKFHHLYGLSLNVKDIDAQFTLGERALKRQEVINQLIEDGVDEMNKGLMLAEVPQKIAVISSPAAAGLGDFLDQINANRFGYRFQADLFKAKMQGNEAAESIIQALHQIFNQIEKNEYYECVVIIRGGGAQVDLDCFDSYDVASHVAQFPIPVITGIGHERDETVLDLVAHTKMKTPTAVAEFLINRLQEFESKLDNLTRIFVQASENLLVNHRAELDQLKSALKLSVISRAIEYRHQLERLEEDLQVVSYDLLSSESEKVSQFRDSLKELANNKIQEQNLFLQTSERLMEMVNPEALLKRGFSVTYINGKLLKQAESPKVGDEIRTKTTEATYLSSLEKIISSKNG